jgi:hypothetical protein
MVGEIKVICIPKRHFTEVEVNFRPVQKFVLNGSDFSVSGLSRFTSLEEAPPYA